MPSFLEGRVVEVEIAQCLTNVEIGLARRDNAKPRIRRVDLHLVLARLNAAKRLASSMRP